MSPSASVSGNGINFTIKLTGFWNRVDVMMDPRKWERVLDAEMTRSTCINCMYLVREVRQRIRSRRYKVDAPLTAILKGSRNPTPLVDRGDLFKAITWKKITKGTYLAGILRTSRTPRGESTATLAEHLHEGITIRVTDSMRNLFWHLHQYSIGYSGMQLTGRALELSTRIKRGQIVPEIGPRVTQIYIPPRPFLAEPFDDPGVRRKLIENWRQGLERALTRIARP
jgi:hypothetical protein